MNKPNKIDKIRKIYKNIIESDLIGISKRLAQNPCAKERHRLLNSKRMQVKDRSETLNPLPVTMEFILLSFYSCSSVLA